MGALELGGIHEEVAEEITSFAVELLKESHGRGSADGSDECDIGGFVDSGGGLTVGFVDFPFVIDARFWFIGAIGDVEAAEFQCYFLLGLVNLDHVVGFDNIAFFEFVPVDESQSTVLTSGHFPDILLDISEGFDIAFVDQFAATFDAHFVVAEDFSIGDV